MADVVRVLALVVCIDRAGVLVPAGAATKMDVRMAPCTEGFQNSTSVEDQFMIQLNYACIINWKKKEIIILNYSQNLKFKK